MGSPRRLRRLDERYGEGGEVAQHFGLLERSAGAPCCPKCARAERQPVCRPQERPLEPDMRITDDPTTVVGSLILSRIANKEHVVGNDRVGAELIVCAGFSRSDTSKRDSTHCRSSSIREISP